jgi:hypothetical protein
MKHPALTLAALALTVPALAEDPPPGRAPTRGATIHVRGERQAPYAFGVTGRSPLGYSALDDPRTFTPEVTRAVRRDPF